MRHIKLALTALFAVLAFSAMAASTASAFHPLFLTLNGKEELLFSGEGGLALLRGLEGTTEGIVDCEHSVTDGFALNLSTLAHRIRVHFLGKCQLTEGLVKATCNEPILTKLLLAELGLLQKGATTPLVVILLAPSDGTGIFATVECSGQPNIVVGGVIVGEIPENNAKLEKQYNTHPLEIEVKFLSVNKSDQQAITEIFLLETQMTKQELKVEPGLLGGGKASEENVAKLKADEPRGIGINLQVF